MTTKSSELELYKSCFCHLAEEGNIFTKVLHVLEVIANSKTGIGEVMQDYAKQAYSQLKDIIRAGMNLVNAHPSNEDMAVLHNANDVIKTVNKFLELTPAAMRRNNAETIGRKEKISTSSIEQISYIFANAPETRLLMTYRIPDEGAETQENLGIAQ